MRARRGAIGVLTWAFLALVALPAHATVVVEIPMERLVADADLVVRASVLRTGGQLETFDGHLEPHTITELAVLDTLNGAATERITIDEIGGEVEGTGSWIEGTPRYARGDEVIVFLRRLPSGAYRTLGMEQGRFTVARAIDGDRIRTVVERDTRTLAFASWAEGRMRVEHGERSPCVELEVFVAFVRSVLDQLALPASSGTVGPTR